MSQESNSVPKQTLDRMTRSAVSRTFQVFLLLVLAAILLAVVTPPVSSPAPIARLVAAKTQMKIFEVALQALRDDTGFYPPGTNGLQDLVRQPAGAANWHGPYLNAEVIPKDPWGHSYAYECPGKHTAAGYPYDLLSLGPPGASNPVANWAEAELGP